MTRPQLVAEKLKRLIKTRSPAVASLGRKILNLPLLTKRPTQIFTEIYRSNKWGDPDSLSGSGSSLVQTESVRAALPSLIAELKCRSLLDVPCGDFFWMRDVELLDIEYTGGDIVADLIARNQRLYGGKGRRFVQVDLINDRLPRADLVLCRDCLVHLSYAHALCALNNIRASGSEYLLTTTYSGRDRNSDVPTGSWRPINLQLPPFQLPAPIRLIDEECPLESFRDKRLGLWRVADVPQF